VFCHNNSVQLNTAQSVPIYCSTNLTAQSPIIKPTQNKRNGNCINKQHNKTSNKTGTCGLNGKNMLAKYENHNAKRGSSLESVSEV
jgi:hypothetical protein